MTHAPREITDLFTAESFNSDAGKTMLRCAAEDRKLLYLTNANGQKLLKIVIKNEGGSESSGQYAQIKIVPYGIKRALVWRDLPSDPLHPILHDDVTLAYHGGKVAGQVPKVHDSIYFFDLFWTQDYLIASKDHPLTSGLIIAPIMFFRMGDSFDWSTMAQDEARLRGKPVASMCL